MTLKGFHIVFIIVSSLLALGVGAWCIRVYAIFDAPGFLYGAIVSFAATIALVVYGVWFYKKMKRLRLIA